MAEPQLIHEQHIAIEIFLFPQLHSYQIFMHLIRKTKKKKIPVRLEIQFECQPL